MKKHKKLFSALVLAAVLVCGIAIGASASGALQEIKAYLNTGITVTLNNEPQTFVDANGNRVYPITYNGSTYLPVRAVAGLVDLDVEWDQTTQTVKLGQTKGVDLIDTYKYYQNYTTAINGISDQYQTGEEQPMEISGVTCSHWITLSRSRNGGNNETVIPISFNLGGKHDTLTFSYYADRNATLQVLGDNGSVLFETEATGGQVAQTVTVPLLKTTQLTFQIKNVSYTAGAKVRIFNAYLDAE